MRMKTRRLERQARVPLGKYFVITLLAVIFVNFLAFVHAGIVVANILLASAFYFVYFKRAVPVRFRKSVSAVYLVLIHRKSNLQRESSYFRPRGLRC